MKRILSLMLALLMVISITACSKNETKNHNPVTPNIENPDIQPDETKAPSVISVPEDATISETVVLDSDGVKVTVKELSTEGFMGPELKLLIENNSGKDLTFQSRNISVNGYMVQTIMSVDVADGKKANDSMILMSSELELCGITTIADIEFSLHIFSSDDWETYLDSPQIQLKTSAAEGFVYSFDDGGELVYEENDIKIVVKGVTDDSFMGSDIVLYMENNSDRFVTVQTRDVSINGFMVNPIFSCEIAPGKHAVDTITILSSELEENGISKIETAELSFHIFESGSFEAIQDSNTITVTF